MSDFGTLRSYLKTQLTDDVTLKAMFVNNVVPVYLDIVGKVIPGPYVVIEFGPSPTTSVMSNTPVLTNPFVTVSVVVKDAGFTAIDTIYERIDTLLLAAGGVSVNGLYIGPLERHAQVSDVSAVDGAAWYTLTSQWSLMTSQG